jgi:hypothetical protein
MDRESIFGVLIAADKSKVIALSPIAMNMNKNIISFFIIIPYIKTFQK